MKKTLPALVLSALLLGPAAARAEDERPSAEEETSAVEERSTAFRAVEGAETESVPGGALLIGAYLALWALALGYLFRLGRLARGVEADVADLRETLKRIDDDVR